MIAQPSFPGPHIIYGPCMHNFFDSTGMGVLNMKIVKFANVYALSLPEHVKKKESKHATR